MSGESTNVVDIKTFKPLPFAELERMAKSVAESGLLPGINTAQKAVTLMAVAQAEGRPAALAILDYHIIEGRPALRADAMLARFQSAGGTVKWERYTDECVAALFSHPAAGSVRIEWTLERAKKIRVFNQKKNSFEPLTERLNWSNYPRAMLRARCVSEGVRTCYPGVAVGMYTPEELRDRTLEGEYEIVSEDEAVAQATQSASLTESELADHLSAMNGASTLDELRAAFATAYRHAMGRGDGAARDAFKHLYDERKKELVVDMTQPPAAKEELPS
jgi:glucose-6-phosphate dehydrogenase assembly protein OpcA